MYNQTRHGTRPRLGLEFAHGRVGVCIVTDFFIHTAVCIRSAIHCSPHDPAEFGILFLAHLVKYTNTTIAKPAISNADERMQALSASISVSRY